MAGDIQVTLSLLLDNQNSIAQQLQAAGGVAGQKFYDGLSGPAKKAFDDLVRQADEAAKKVGIAFNRTTLKFESVSGNIIPPDTLNALAKINAGFKEAKQAVDVFKTATSSATKESAQNFNLLEAAVTGVAVSLTSRLTDALTGTLGSVKQVLGGYMELDGELRLAAAAAGETGGYERLGVIVNKVGIDAAGTAKQVAELATSLVRAGFSVTEVETALPGVVKGAEATGTAFERFGEITGSTLRQFGLEASETSRVVDVMIQTLNGSNASVEGFAYAMNEAAPVAKALGVSLEDTASVIGIMANAGLQGSVAGTGFKTMLLKLQQAAGGATPEVLGLAQGQERLAKIMKMMGGDVLDASGKMLPLDQALKQLKGNMDKLGQGDRAALATALFGEDGGPKFLAIINQGFSSIDSVFTKVRNSAGATDTARNAMAGIGLEMQQLQGTIDSLLNNVGSVFAAGIRPIVGIANQTVGAISALPDPIKNTAGAMALLATAAATASVGIGALNVAVGTMGGWSVLRKEILSVATVLTGPIAVGTVAILGVAAAAYGLYGAFNGVDKTTKTLIQTMAGLATFVAVMRGITAAQKLWTEATKATAVAQAFLVALTGPRGLAQVAVAAAAAAAAYYGMGAIIKETGAETSALSEKSKGLKDEIAKLGQEIEQGRKLKIDTSEVEKLKALKEKELREIESPLEIKLSIERAESQIKSLGDQINKLKGGFFGLFGNQDNVDPKLEAQLKAAEKYRDILKATDQGVKSDAFAGLDESAKSFVRTQIDIDKRIADLQKKKVALRITATADRAAIDKEISSLSDLKGKNNIKLQASFNLDALKAQLAQLDAERKKLESTKIRDDGSVFSVASREEEKRKKINIIVQKQLGLQTEIAAASNKLVDSSEKQASAAKKQVLTEEKKLEIAKAKLSTEQLSVDLANRLTNVDKSRLQTVQQIADAYSNLANAQAALTQSGFDVQSARNNRSISTAEQELQALRERGGSIDEIRAKEQEIIDLKKNGENIEKAAMAAAIDAAAKRFEMERKVLELKQASQAIEQQGAVRTAQRGVLEDRKQLLELQSKMKDPTVPAEQKAAIAEQIKLQEQSIQLSQAQVAAEQERLQSLQTIFGLERQALDAQQQTQANQFRSGAAGKGWEGEMAGGLQNLDKQAGITYKTFQRLVGTIEIPGRPIENIYETVTQVEDATKKSSVAWEDVNKAAQKVLGTINDHNKAIDEGKKKVGELANTYKDINSKNQSGSTIQAATDKTQKEPSFASSNDARTQELEKQKAWKKQMEDAGIIEFRAKGVPKSETDAIIKNVLDIAKDFNSNEAGVLIVSSGNPNSTKPGPSWYSEEELAGIKKIQNATKQTADEFFAASDSATYLERSLKAIGKVPTFQEKQKYFAQAMADVVNDKVDGLKFLSEIRPLRYQDGYFKPVISQPKDFMEQAKTLANKQSFNAFHPFAETESFLDQYAAKLVDAEAKTKGLAGAIEGARDSIGRPIEDTPFNFKEINKNFVEDARKALSPEAVKKAMEGQDFSLLPKKQEIDIAVNPDMSGLADVRNQLGQTTDAAATFNSTLSDAFGGASNDFYNAANSIIPFSSGLQDVTTSLQDLGYTDIKNPFDSWQSSVDQTATGLDSIAGSFNTASQNADSFNQSLPDVTSAQQLQAAYDALSTTPPPDISQAADQQVQLNDDTQAAIDKTLELSATWDIVKGKIEASVGSLQQFAVPTARWAGGWLDAGQTATVNELGRESFLSSSGVLSLIQSPQYGRWTPPSSGMVLPAGLTARLEAVGAFDNSKLPTVSHGQPMAVPTPKPIRGNSSQIMAINRLKKSIDRLEQAMSNYKPPELTVNLPGNDRLLSLGNRIL